MAARLGVPVEAWNPFANPALDAARLTPGFTEENHPFLVTGIGLALKELLAVPARRVGRAGAPSPFRNPLAKAA